MAALTAARNTDRLGAMIGVAEGHLKANTRVYKGSLVMKDPASGYLVPGAAAVGAIAWGRAETGTEAYADSTGQANGAVKVKVDCGVFAWANSAAGDLIAKVDEGNDCYIVDDQTVAKTDGGGTRSKAGRIILVEGSRVYVRTSVL
jgi:hypothetical protein